MASRWRVSLFLMDEDNDYQSALRQECQQVGARHRMQVAVVGAQNRSATQVEQIRNAISAAQEARPNVILVSPVSEVALLSLAHSAAREGIAWVFLNRWHDSIHDLRRQYSTVPIFAVTADQEQVGAVQGKQLQRLLHAGDELLYIQGPLGTSSVKARLKGLKAELAESTVQITTFHSDWTVSGGKSVTTQWLTMLPRAQLPGLVVAAQNDRMAEGAREAIVEWSSGRGGRIENVDILGCDGSPSYGQRLVSSGKLTATVFIPPVTGRALEAIVRCGIGATTSCAALTVPVQAFPSVELMRSLRT